MRLGSLFKISTVNLHLKNMHHLQNTKHYFSPKATEPDSLEGILLQEETYFIRLAFNHGLILNSS